MKNEQTKKQQRQEDKDAILMVTVKTETMKIGNRFVKVTTFENGKQHIEERFGSIRI